MSMLYLLSHKCNNDYLFFRSIDATQPHNVTHVGYKLYLNLSKNSIEHIEQQLQIFMHQYGILYYLKLDEGKFYAGKNLIIHLGENIDAEKILEFISQVEKLAKKYKLQPEKLDASALTKRQPVNGSKIFCYRYDANEQKKYSVHLFNEQRHSLLAFTKKQENRRQKKTTEKSIKTWRP